MVNNRNEIRANVSIFRACYSQSKLENTKKIQELTSVIKKTPEILRKISEQKTLNVLNTLGKFLRSAFESINSE